MSEPTKEMIDAGVRAHGGHRNIGEQVAAIYTAMEAARPPMKIEPADPIVFEDDTGAYTRPTTDVSTDVLVEELRERALELHSTAWGRMDGGQECTISAMLAERAADRIEALQRSNAEKDEALREIILKSDEDCVLRIASKALSHSSETPDA